MAKTNYSFEKRQREIAKKKKQDEKRQRKQQQRPAEQPAPGVPGEPTTTSGETATD